MATEESLEHLPTPRHLLTNLIQSPNSPSDEYTPDNPLSAATPEEQKNIFLTLHVLFANELLPALDLLDRGLVTRMRLELSHTETHDPVGTTEHTAYYVRSSQSPPSNSRYHNSHSTGEGFHTQTSYAVQLASWSCSCPAFAFAAFPSSLPEASKHVHVANDLSMPESTESNWKFGGLGRGDDLPVCKHILACVLAEHTPLFEGAVEERSVSLEEWAGWAAGWGD